MTDETTASAGLSPTSDPNHPPSIGVQWEIWPGVPTTKPAVRFDLLDPDDNPLGALYMTSDLSSASAWQDKGWHPKAQYWVWDDGDWPTGDFSTRNATDLDGDPPPVPDVVARHMHDFKQSGAYTTTQNATKVPLYAVSTTQSGAPGGYIKVAQLDDNSIKAYSTVDGATSIAAKYDDDLYFTRQSGQVSISAYGYRKDTVIP